MAYSRTSPLINPLIGTLLFSLMLSTCTVYYKTSDIKKTFSKSQREMNKTLGQIARDRREKRGIYNQLISHISDSSQTPYPQLSIELNSMTRSVKTLKQSVKQLEQLNTKFMRHVKGKSKIEGNSPLWDEFQTVKKEYESQTENFESLSDTYGKSSNRFIGLLNKHHISKVKVPEVRQQIDDFLSELTLSIQQISDEISKIQSDERIDKQILNQLEEILILVNAEQHSLESLIRQFEKEVGNETIIWSGPGMISYSILSDMQAVGKNISRLAEKFNRLASKL